MGIIVKTQRPSGLSSGLAQGSPNARIFSEKCIYMMDRGRWPFDLGRIFLIAVVIVVDVYYLHQQRRRDILKSIIHGQHRLHKSMRLPKPFTSQSPTSRQRNRREQPVKIRPRRVRLNLVETLNRWLHSQPETIAMFTDQPALQLCTVTVETGILGRKRLRQPGRVRGRLEAADGAANLKADEPGFGAYANGCLAVLAIVALAAAAAGVIGFGVFLEELDHLLAA